MAHGEQTTRGPRLFARHPRTEAGVAALEGLQDLSDAVHEADEQALRALQLRSSDALALQQLANARGEGRSLNPTQLAGLLRLTTAAITKLVDRLVRDGRVERQPNPKDRRGIVVQPTESALVDLARAYAHIHAPVVDVIDGLTDDEAAAVERFAHRLSVALRDSAHREVDVDGLPGAVLRSGAGEEDRDGAGVVGTAVPPEERPRRERGARRVRSKPLVQRRGDEAGNEDVRGDALV